MNIIVAAVGIVLLMFIAVGIGMSLDTEGQRREAARVARQRRLLAEQQGARQAMYRCPDCPYRFLG